MSGLIERLIARFPHIEAAVRGTEDAHDKLGSLFQEFEDVEHRISKLDQPGAGVSIADADRLRRRRAYLEEEMLTMMQHYGRP